MIMQTSRLKVGNLSVVTSVYENRMVVSIYNSFLIITLLAHVRLLCICKEQEKNEALMIALVPQNQGVLNNLALEIENSSC